MSSEPTSGSPGSGIGSELPAHAAYRVTLPEFEGPLDLLLHLCQTHELDILHIPIAFVARKYIEYLEIMQDMSVEIAAEYLVMAAHLAYLKSRELVPAPEPIESSEEEEEPLDPREELIRRLLEYQKYKHAAENLGNRPIEGRNVFVRGMSLEAAGEAGFAEHSVWKLLEHWAGILKTAKPEITHNVLVDRVSISDRINQIVDLLEASQGMIRFEDMVGRNLGESEQRHRIVITLLAILELARLKVLRVMQEEATASFFLVQTASADLEKARKLRVTSTDDGENGNEAPSEATPATAPQAAAEATLSEAEATPPDSGDTPPLAADAPPESEVTPPMAEEVSPTSVVTAREDVESSFIAAFDEENIAVLGTGSSNLAEPDPSPTEISSFATGPASVDELQAMTMEFAGMEEIQDGSPEETFGQPAEVDVASAPSPTWQVEDAGSPDPAFAPPAPGVESPDAETQEKREPPNE